MSKEFKEWTVKIRIHDSCVAEGYYATASSLKRNILRDLIWFEDDDVEVEITERPSDHKVAYLKGYKCLGDMLEAHPEYRTNIKA